MHLLTHSFLTHSLLVVLLLVIGLYVFITSDYSDSPSGTGSGIFFVTCSMIASASIPTVQEHVMSKYGASVEELLYIQYFGSAVLSLLFSIVTGEFIQVKWSTFLLTHSLTHSLTYSFTYLGHALFIYTRLILHVILINFVLFIRLFGCDFLNGYHSSLWFLS